MITVALLAAGKSARFGRDCKLQTPFRGKPLVRHIANAIVETGLPAIAIVSDPDVAALLPEFQIVYSDGPKSQTLQSACNSVLSGDLLITLADMPFVGSELLTKIASCHCPVITTDGVRTAPPALIPRNLFENIKALRGDDGAAKVICQSPRSERIQVRPEVLTDLDIKIDFEKWA